jgi:TolA-binding protein
MLKKITFILLVVLVMGYCYGRDAFSRAMGEDDKLIRVGTGAFQDGFFDISEKQFSQFLKEYPDHPRLFEVCYLLGRTLHLKEKLAESRSVFLKVLNEGKQFEHTDYVHFWLADIELRLGNNDRARNYLLAILNRHPKFEGLDQVYYFLGLIEFASNRLPRAESHFKRASALTKSNEIGQSAAFWLGILSFKQARFDEAAARLKTLTVKVKPFSSFYSRYVPLWLGEARLRLGQIEEAKTTYSAFYEPLKEDPFFQEILWKLGFCNYRIGNQAEAVETFKTFRTQFKDSPLLSYTHYLLGEVYLNQRDHAASMKELNMILTMPKENVLWGMAYLSLYWNHFQQNDLPGANKVFQRLQKLNHFDEEKIWLQWINAEVHFLKGDIADSLPYYFNVLNTEYRERALSRIGKGYFWEDKFKEAITNFDIFLLEFPNSKDIEETLFMKGECFVRSGTWTQALDTYRDLALRDGHHHWKLFALIQAGNIHSSLKENSEAKTAFKQVLEHYPGHPLSSYAAFRLGELFFKGNQMPDALHYYSMILQGEQVQLMGGTYFCLGEVLYQLGKYDRARRSFEMALKYLDGSSPWFYLTHLEIGNLQRKKGHVEEARRSYGIIASQSKDEDLKKAAGELLRLMEPEKK